MGDLIYVNLHDGSSDEGRDDISSPVQFNNLDTPTTTGVRVADLVDSANVATGRTLTVNEAWENTSANSTWATSGSGNFPQEFFDSAWHSSGGLDIGDIEISAITGETYTILAAGHAAADRDTNYPVTGEGTNGSPYDGVTGATPTAPITITGTVVANKVIITNDGVGNHSYLNGFSIEFASAGGSIDSITSPITDGTTGNVFSTSGFGTITGAVLKDATGNYSTDVFASLNTTGSGANTFDLADFTANRLEGDAGTVHVNWDTASHTHVLEITDGTLTDTIAVVINPQSGWSVFEVTSASTANGSYFYQWTGGAPANKCQVLYPDTFNTDASNPTAAGVYDTGIQESGTFWHQFHDVADNKLKAFDVVLTEGRQVLQPVLRSVLSSVLRDVL